MEDELPFEELDPCCQREIIERRNYNDVTSRLRNVDRSENRTDQRSDVLMSKEELERQRFHFCRCCEINLDYEQLASLRLRLANGDIVESVEDHSRSIDSDDEFLRELEEEDKRKREEEETNVRRIQERNFSVLRRVGLGDHREEDMGHLCALTQSETLTSVGSPLLLHLYVNSHISATVDLVIEQLASTDLQGVRCRRMNLHAYYQEIHQSKMYLTRTALGSQLQGEMLNVRSQLSCTNGEEGVLLLFTFHSGGTGHECVITLRDREVYAETVEDSIPLLRRCIDRAGIANVALPYMSSNNFHITTSGSEDENDSSDSGFNCGVVGCHRRYPHEHVQKNAKPSFLSVRSEESRPDGSEALAPNIFSSL